MRRLVMDGDDRATLAPLHGTSSVDPEPQGRQMTRSPFARRGLLAALLVGSMAWLAACGGGDDDNGSESGTAQWRVLNLNGEVASVDVYTGTDQRFTNVTLDTKTAYSGINSGSHTVSVRTAGSSTSLMSGAYSLSKDLQYTGIVWGRGSAVRFSTLPENEDNNAISTGATRVRIFNANTDAGAFDVYLTVNTPLDQLGNTTPINGTTSVAAGALGGFRELAPNTYQLRVTAGGKPNDVRLDATLTVPDKVHSTLILNAGTGGALVNAALLVQRGDLTVVKNTKARLRVAAGVENNTVVSSVASGSTTPVDLRSPSYTSYRLVDAGTVTVTVAGQTTTTAALAAGGDYTVIAYGTPGAATVKLFTDDNHLPATGSARVRLYNGAASTGPLKLNIGLAELLSDVSVGAMQSVTTSLITTASTVTVSSGFQALFSQEDVVLPYGVYTVYMLGGNVENGAPKPAGAIFQDR
jgi:hypothetical protein